MNKNRSNYKEVKIDWLNFLNSGKIIDLSEKQIVSEEDKER